MDVDEERYCLGYHVLPLLGRSLAFNRDVSSALQSPRCIDAACSAELHANR